jgi:hypothetical protein
MRRYGLPAGSHPDFEVDHLVPLEIGGADDDSDLWAQPRRSIEPTWNAEKKDELEFRLRELVCSGALDVATAQNEIASDWVAAYAKYVGRGEETATVSTLGRAKADRAATGVTEMRIMGW